jgi:AcrR family transcriptional regulator
MPRIYDNSRRARHAQETAERIVDVTEALLAGGPIAEVTLQAIAEGAGVSIQTVLRHHGSRDGCIEAVGERVLARIDAQRGSVPSGDVESALAALLEHYEAEGRLVLNLLAQEAADSWARHAVEAGRAYHRAWVQRSFGPRFSPDDRELVDALVAATDIYVWKLLRLDLGRSPEEVLSVVRRLVYTALET